MARVLPGARRPVVGTAPAVLTGAGKAVPTPEVGDKMADRFTQTHDMLPTAMLPAASVAIWPAMITS